MKARTQMRIGMIGLVVLVCLDIYGYFPPTWPCKVLIGLSVETIFYGAFAISLIARKSRMAEWVYYNWWTLQLLPLLFALIYVVYLISNKYYLTGLLLSLSFGLIVGLPVIFFRVGLKGLEKTIEIESHKNESIKAEQKQ